MCWGVSVMSLITPPGGRIVGGLRPDGRGRAPVSPAVSSAVVAAEAQKLRTSPWAAEEYGDMYQLFMVSRFEIDVTLIANEKPPRPSVSRILRQAQEPRRVRNPQTGAAVASSVASPSLRCRVEFSTSVRMRCVAGSTASTKPCSALQHHGLGDAIARDRAPPRQPATQGACGCRRISS